MPQITLKREQVQRIADIANGHGLTNFFLAKDDGAYVGITAVNEYSATVERAVYYFKGCDPNRDPDYYDQSRHMFGGDDFGEWFPISALTSALDKGAKSLTIKVNPTSIALTAKF